MFLGAAGLAMAALAGMNRRRLEAQIRTLEKRVEEIDSRTGEIPKLQAQTDRNTQTIHDIQSAVARMEQGFAMLGDRLGTQIQLLEALQSDYNEKEEKLQATLHAVIEAVNEVRRSRVPSAV